MSANYLVAWDFPVVRLFLRERNTTVSRETEEGVPGDNAPGPTIRIDVTARQLELLTDAVHERLLAAEDREALLGEPEDADEPDYLVKLRDVDELLRGSHPRWNAQTQAFFEVRPVPDEDYGHLLRTVFAEPEEGDR